MVNREYETRENHQSRTEDGRVGSKFLLGAFIGGVAGAVAGMLLAPKSGKELRRKINEQASLLMDKSVQLRENVVEKGNGLTAVTKDKAAAITKTVAQQSIGLVQKARDLTSETQDTLEEEAPTTYISLNIDKTDHEAVVEKVMDDDQEVQKRLEEAKRALEEEENRISLK
ncbi:YtxH domain-containing protein [Bacillota bacterium Lsc_1132]